MWEWTAFHSLLALLFGEGFCHATRNMSKVKRDSIIVGMLVWVTIWVLCFVGEIVIPPLKVLRSCFDEDLWIIGKVVVWLLALPVGFPMGYFVTKHWLQRKAKNVTDEGIDLGSDLLANSTPDQIQIKARRIQRMYVISIAIILWAWYWFLTPVRDWLDQGEGATMSRTLGLLVVWLILAALFGIGGGRIVYHIAERRLRRRN